MKFVIDTANTKEIKEAWQELPIRHFLYPFKSMAQ